MNKKDAVEFFLKSLDIDTDQDFINRFDSISSIVKKTKKEIIFLENETGSNLYFLISGSVKLFRTNKDGKEAIIYFVEPGEFFAEVILFMHNKYPVSSMAIKNSELLSINSQKMFNIIKNQPDFALKFIGIITRRLSYLVNIIKNLSIMDAQEKFLNYLHIIKKDDNTIMLNIPKGEISLLLGISPETFSRVLRKLTDDKILEIKGKNIKILKEGTLANTHKTVYLK